MDHHVSLTGERVGLFSRLLLRIDTFDEATQDYNSEIKDIFQIFLQSIDILSTVLESDKPVTSSGIAAYVLSKLLEYRRLDVAVPLADLEGFFTYLSNYRLKSELILQNEVQNLPAALNLKRDIANEAFVSILTDTLVYDNGTDLKTTISAIGDRISNGENSLSQLSTARRRLRRVEAV